MSVNPLPVIVPVFSTVPPPVAYIPALFPVVPVKVIVPPVFWALLAPLETIPIFAVPFTTILLLFTAEGSPVASVVTLPLSTLIPILWCPFTFIVPPASFTILSGALIFKSIPEL